MKQAVAAATFFALAAAQGPPGWGPNGGPGGPWGGPGGPWGGPWGNLPSCLGDCSKSAPNFSDICSTEISGINSCIADSSCSSSEKNDAYQAIAQLCANSGTTVTAKPEATWSATSGGNNYPSAWTTNSAWASAFSSWSSVYTAGWNGQGGPFGGPGPHGWGPWGSSGSWTQGPWTNWWGTSGCPASTWSGWTSGAWATDAPWTTWSGCSASTTATSVVTTTVTSAGTTAVVTTTNYGLKLADATAKASQTASSTATPNAAPVPTNFKVVGSAAGVIGVVAGALLL